jgi:hypothetical protein
MQACNIVQVVAVILFNVAALKIAGGLFTLGALVWGHPRRGALSPRLRRVGLSSVQDPSRNAMPTE